MKNTLVKVRAGLAALTTVGLLTIVGGLPASAGAAPLQVDPTSVHAGATVNASSYCNDSDLSLLLFAGASPSYGQPAGTPIVTTTPTNWDQQTGAWSGSLTVPEGTAPGQYTVSAHCYGEGEIYQNGVITVLADATTTTTTTTMPSTTTTSVPPVAPPAPTVRVTPTYTG